MTFLRALWAKILAEPTAVAALISGVLPLLVLLHSQWLTETEVGLIAAGIAAVLGFIVAVATKHPTLAVCLGLLQAMAAIGTAYGFTLSSSDMAILVGVLGVIAHTFNWAGTGAKVRQPNVLAGLDQDVTDDAPGTSTML